MAAEACLDYFYFDILQNDVYVYLYFCLIWALSGLLYFTSLFFSLSVSLHDSTKESTFILKLKKKVKLLIIICMNIKLLPKTKMNINPLMLLPVHGTGRSLWIAAAQWALLPHWTLAVHQWPFRRGQHRPPSLQLETYSPSGSHIQWTPLVLRHSL